MIIEIEVGKHDVNNVRTTQSPVERKHTTNTNCTLLVVRSLACAFVIVHLYVVVLVVMNDDGGKK